MGQNILSCQHRTKQKCGWFKWLLKTLHVIYSRKFSYKMDRIAKKNTEVVYYHIEKMLVDLW